MVFDQIREKGKALKAKFATDTEGLKAQSSRLKVDASKLKV
jgi:hypothetical protein